jgi:hypothetical protein
MQNFVLYPAIIQMQWFGYKICILLSFFSIIWMGFYIDTHTIIILNFKSCFYYPLKNAILNFYTALRYTLK